MITYDQIKAACVQTNVQLSELAALSSLTPQGFKKAIDRGTITAAAVLPICERLQITLPQFFGRAPVVYTDSSLRLASDIAQLQATIESKDRQIAQLISLLSEAKTGQK